MCVHILASYCDCPTCLHTHTHTKSKHTVIQYLLPVWYNHLLQMVNIHWQRNRMWLQEPESLNAKKNAEHFTLQLFVKMNMFFPLSHYFATCSLTLSSLRNFGSPSILLTPSLPYQSDLDNTVMNVSKGNYYRRRV